MCGVISRDLRYRNQAQRETRSNSKPNASHRSLASSSSCNQRLFHRVAILPRAGPAIGAEPLLLPESYIWCKFNHTTDCTLIRLGDVRRARGDLVFFGANPRAPDATWTHSLHLKVLLILFRKPWASWEMMRSLRAPCSRLAVIKPAAAEASFPSPLCRARSLRRKRKFRQQKKKRLKFISRTKVNARDKP
jgi:hypothetical protein